MRANLLDDKCKVTHAYTTNSTNTFISKDGCPHLGVHGLYLSSWACFSLILHPESSTVIRNYAYLAFSYLLTWYNFPTINSMCVTYHVNVEELSIQCRADFNTIYEVEKTKQPDMELQFLHHPFMCRLA